MQLILKAKLVNVYQSNEYKNKETGEVSKSKTKLQLLTVNKMKDGSDRQEILDISVPPEKTLLYKNKIGQEVSVDIAIIGKSTFYGV